MARRSPESNTPSPQHTQHSQASDSHDHGLGHGHESAEGDDGLDMRFIGSREELAAARTIASRQRLRDQLSDEVRQFLERGGTINQIEPNVSADPPRKPGSNYGQRPI